MRHASLVRIAILAVGFMQAAAALAEEPIQVVMDRAKVMRLSAPAESVIVGNPGIADVTVHDRTTLVLTGKMVGMTNLLVMDRSGTVIAEATISVAKVDEGLVTVQRGTTRNSYSCTPNCSPTIEVGDSSDFFGTTNGQSLVRSSIGLQTNTTPAQ